MSKFPLFFRLLTALTLVLGLAGLALAAPPGQNPGRPFTQLSAEHEAIRNQIGTVEVQIGQLATDAEMSAQHGMIKQNVADAQTAIQGDIADVKALVEALAVPLCGAGTEGQRFVVLGADVCDNTTGLYWQRALSTTGSIVWGPEQGTPNAIDFCRNLDLGNGHAYRLPEIKELSSLVDYGQFAPALPTGHPFSGFGGVVFTQEVFWSASVRPLPVERNAWGVTITTGSVELFPKTRDSRVDHRVWCVRN